MELEALDIRTLVDNGLIAPKENAHLEIRTFSVVEERKRRRRWITHTADSNKLEKDVASWLSKKSPRQDLCTPTPHVATSRLMKQYATAIDFAAYYHQFALDPQDRMWFFRANGREWELTTIPTGSAFAPELAQIFSVALCGWVKYHFPLIVADTYIDNVRFSADDPGYLRDALGCMYELCAQHEVGIVINEPVETALAIIDAQKYEFLGVEYDHRTQEVQICKHVREKIAASATTTDDTLSIRDVLAWYGRLSYATVVYRLARAPYYMATKYLRRRVGRELDAPAKLWPSARKALVEWGRRILEIGPCRVTHPDSSLGAATLFTDASGKGYGGVLFTTTGGVAITAGKWAENSSSINVLEARALRFCLVDFTDVLRDVNCLDVKIDNTSALGALLKTHSPAWELNKEVGLIIASPLWASVRSVQYVRSEDNRADVPSRLGAHTFIRSSNPFLFKRWMDAL